MYAAVDLRASSEIYVCRLRCWDDPKEGKGGEKRKPDREKYDYRLNFHGGFQSSPACVLITLTLGMFNAS